MGIGIYAMYWSDERTMTILDNVTDVVMNHDGILQIHGFKADHDTKRISADVVFDFSVTDIKASRDNILKDLREMYPDYEINVIMDVDV
ncbi:MAG: hypothetical protein IJM62_06195 [Lachnospiraceae bacterium]|nr:hypothetical protein [Lachnospiraceae bacterium]